jgi:hypothetical protein
MYRANSDARRLREHIQATIDLAAPVQAAAILPPRIDIGAPPEHKENTTMSTQRKSKAMPRPLRRLTTKQLCSALMDPDVSTTVDTVGGPVAVTFALAYAEANARLDHAHTLQPQNAKMLAKAFAIADDFVEVAPEPEPAPEIAPETKTAATAFADRVKRIAKDGSRITLAIRARKLAIREEFTSADIDALTDEDCLELVAEPVR